MNSLAKRAGNGSSGMTESDESIFDPYLAEVMYAWFNVEGGGVLDPFCGGSVRGVVAEKLGYPYTGFDIREEQILFNEKNASLCGEHPTYIHSDSNKMDDFIDDKTVDMVFSCPPYADLEVYSDLEDDISNMEYNEFIKVYASIIKKTFNALKDDRFACFVIGEVRGKKGDYYNFVGDTVKAFIDAGYKYYNEIIFVNSAGTAALRAGSYMKNRKVAKIHQNILVFYKGDMKKISAEFEELSEKYINIVEGGD